MSADPFGTATLRARALAAWTASPVRLREDANAEDDSALTAYHDRLVIELAQNAADAARRVGAAGQLRLHLDGDVFYAANPGAPLDAAGVEALAHRRVSTKGRGDVGRFGVGFTAVLAVTEDPSIWTGAGGVAWSRTRTAETLSAIPEVADEVRRRNGVVPVMRLPWEAGRPDDVVRRLLGDGAATVVRLPLRDTAAVERTRAMLESVDPLLLLFLEQLDSLTVDGVEPARSFEVHRDDVDARLVVDGVASDWRLQQARGELDAAMLAERPVEEREHASWALTWAVPVVDGRPVAYSGDHRLRAPQPVEEVVALPAVLSATVPLESGRRHVVGDAPATREVVRRAARAYADLLAACPPGPWLVDLLPSTLPAGPVDLLLRDELAEVLPRARFLASAADPEVRLRPEEAAVLDLGAAAAEVTTLLGPHAPRLVTPDHISGGRRQAALVGLGTRLLDTADTIELLGAVEAPPSWWGTLTVALAQAPDRDALRALPVPLADGGTASGARDLYLPADAVVVDALDVLGLTSRVVHPDVVAAPGATEVLRGLGARDAEPATLLDDPRLRAAVDAGDEDDQAALADAVLSLLAAAPQLGAARPWLSELMLPQTGGELRPAGELLLPAAYGGCLVTMVDPAGPFGLVDGALVERHGVDAVVATGVLRGFATLREDDVPLAPGGLAAYLDDADGWLADIARALPEAGAFWVLDQVVAVRDLELVRADPDAWALALDELGREHLPRVIEPVIALRDGARAQLEAYSSWWLRRHACVPAADGSLRRPDAVAAADADAVLRDLHPAAAPLTDDASRLLEHLRPLRGIASASAEQVATTLERLGAAGPQLGTDAVRSTYAALLRRSLEVGSARTPVEVTAVLGDRLVVVGGVDAVVVDAPDLVPLLRSHAAVPCSLDDAVALADLLDLDLASEAVGGAVLSQPVRRDRIDAAALEVLGLDASLEVAVHDPLLCADESGAAAPLPWRLLGGSVHVDARDVAYGTSRALAAAAGAWSRRHEVRAWLTGAPDDRATLAAEAELD